MAGEVHSGPDSLDGVIMPNPLLSPWLYRTWGAFPTQVSRAELCAGPRRERLSQFLNYLGYFNGFNYPLPFYWKKEVNVSGGLLPVSRCIDTPLMEIKKNVEAIGFLDQEQSHHRLAFLTHPQCSSSWLVFFLVSPLWSAEEVGVSSRGRSGRPGMEFCPALLPGWPWATPFPLPSPSFFVCKIGDSDDKAIKALAAIIKPSLRARCFIHRSSPNSLAKTRVLLFYKWERMRNT